MQTELLKEIQQVLQNFPQYWNGETLKRFDVVTAIENKKPDLIKAIIANQKLKQTYSTDIDGVLLFDFAKLVALIQYKEYWNDSYTKYKNKIGLTTGGNYLDYNTDVIITFPFKDCVLEGGMSKAEVANKDDFTEVYYNEIIASDEIDRLFSPKVLTKAVRYSEGGVENVVEFNDKDNLLIKGNNLLALHSLKERFLGKIKLICIDPPYYFSKNKPSDSFKYNSNFKLSTWLVFMKDRLEIAKELLADNGVILVNINEDGNAYLKILMTEIFGEDNFVSTILWKRSESQNNNSKLISTVGEFIICFAKNKNICTFNKIALKETALKEYRYIDELTGKPFRRGTIVDNSRGNYEFEVISPNGIKKNIKSIRKKEFVEEKDKNGEIYWTETGTPYLKLFLDNSEGQITSNWLDDVGVNEDSSEHLNSLKINFSFSKPEKLLQHFIHIATNPNDIVLDFFAGSGTTCAVAHKMGRRWIGIEQMDYIENITKARLKKVIDGEQGGISKAVDWQGGGSFVYFELAKLNQNYVDKINQADNTEQLLCILETMKAEAYLNYQIQLDKILQQTYEEDGVDHEITFSELPLVKQKEILTGLLDKNQLYINLSEIDDQNMQVSDSDKQFTRSFYQIDCEKGE